MKTKSAWLWVVDWGENCTVRVSADLFFSSKEKLGEIVPWIKVEEQQLVEVQVPEVFDHWDFVPDNY